MSSIGSCSSSFTSTSTLQGSIPPSKKSVFTSLKRLVTPSKTKQQPAPRPVSPNTHNRRVEALKSVGLLKQSRVYGPAYRDDDDNATIVSDETNVAADYAHKKAENIKDLIQFDESDDVEALKTANIHNTKEKIVDVPSSNGTETLIPTLQQMGYPDHGAPITDTDPSSNAGVCSPSSEDMSTQKTSSIQIRRQGSISAEVDKIDDEESRHLTEVAYLY